MLEVRTISSTYNVKECCVPWYIVSGKWCKDANSWILSKGLSGTTIKIVY